MKQKFLKKMKTHQKLKLTHLKVKMKMMKQILKIDDSDQGTNHLTVKGFVHLIQSGI